MRNKKLSESQKWLLVGKLLDNMEEGFRKVYPNEAPPFPDGYKESLRRLFCNGMK